MAQNISPIFIKQGDLTSESGTTFPTALILAANDVTGAGANNILVFTSPADGAFLQKLRIKPLGTNGAASMLRIFINNGLTNATPANNILWDEQPLAASTLSTTVPMQVIEYNFNILMPPAFRIYCGLTVAGTAGWAITPVAGEY